MDTVGAHAEVITAKLSRRSRQAEDSVPPRRLAIWCEPARDVAARAGKRSSNAIDAEQPCAAQRPHLAWGRRSRLAVASCCEIPPSADICLDVTGLGASTARRTYPRRVLPGVGSSALIANRTAWNRPQPTAWVALRWHLRQKWYGW